MLGRSHLDMLASSGSSSRSGAVPGVTPQMLDHERPLNCIPCNSRNSGASCDKAKPTCGRCASKGIACSYPTERKRRGPCKNPRQSIRHGMFSEAKLDHHRPLIPLPSYQKRDEIEGGREGIRLKSGHEYQTRSVEQGNPNGSGQTSARHPSTFFTEHSTSPTPSQHSFRSQKSTATTIFHQRPPLPTPPFSSAQQQGPTDQHFATGVKIERQPSPAFSIGNQVQVRSPPLSSHGGWFSLPLGVFVRRAPMQSASSRSGEYRSAVRPQVYQGPFDPSSQPFTRQPLAVPSPSTPVSSLQQSPLPFAPYDFGRNTTSLSHELSGRRQRLSLPPSGVTMTHPLSADEDQSITTSFYCTLRPRKKTRFWKLYMNSDTDFTSASSGSAGPTQKVDDSRRKALFGGNGTVKVSILRSSNPSAPPVDL
nr:uncharacterized protein CI109_001229 [Kwoniella shandongensis]KAA5530426.1 hypothetical protein CI109_001229 [Kwoniella shandongensis]